MKEKVVIICLTFLLFAVLTDQIWIDKIDKTTMDWCQKAPESSRCNQWKNGEAKIGHWYFFRNNL